MVRFSSGLFLAAAFLPAIPGWSADALESYVKQPDPTYRWKLVKTTNDQSWSISHVELTSQTWRTNIWTHHLQIVRPPQVRNPHIAFLFVTGDGRGTSTLGLLRTLVERAGAIAAVVTRVPNQPLYGGRHEDALIAYTFAQYCETGDETWPLLFPMVKSAVRAMDAVQAFAAETHGQQVREFVVGGASKRGWTTWLTAATDTRVVAMAPMVIDMLNMKAQTDWASKVYGRQSEQISDYTENNLVEKIDTPPMVKLRGWVDPYSYRARYKIPKLLLLGTNDRYWTVDSLRHYWDDLPGPKLIYQTPNAGHDLGGGREATQTLAAFFQMIADREPLPQFEWKVRDGAEAGVRMQVNQKAKRMNLWMADSDDRDFRDAKWNSRPLRIESGSSIAAEKVSPPANGYRAFMGEVVLTARTGHDYKLSTQVQVLPDEVK